jgi:hypothetical protein
MSTGGIILIPLKAGPTENIYKTNKKRLKKILSFSNNLKHENINKG